VEGTEIEQHVECLLIAERGSTGKQLKLLYLPAPSYFRSKGTIEVLSILEGPGRENSVVTFAVMKFSDDGINCAFLMEIARSDITSFCFMRGTEVA